MHQIGKSTALAFLLAFLFVWPAFAATSIPFTVNLSEAVNVTGAPRIAVNIGGVTRYATYTSGSGTSALIFTYSMVAGDVDLDGVTVSSPIDLNGGTIKDLVGNDLSSLTFTPPNTTNVKVNYPSLGMDFVYDADGRYTLNGAVYNNLSSLLSATGGSFTRASIGTYFDSTGTLQTASANTPRFDYDPVTQDAKGILIEQSSTNTLKSTSTGIGQFSGSMTSNYALAPNGTNTATMLTTTGTYDNGSRLYGVGMLPSTQYTFSVFAKLGGPDPARYAYLRNIALGETAQSDNTAVYDLQTGLAGFKGINVTNSGMYNVGNGWYRIWMTGTTTATIANNMLDIKLGDVSNGGTTTAVGRTMLFWGSQLEQLSFPTSYIPTTTAAVTRVEDTLTLPTSLWFNGVEGTLLGRAATIADATFISSRRQQFINFSDGGLARLTMRMNNSGNSNCTIGNGSVNNDLGLGPVTQNIYKNMGCSYSASGSSSSYNGTAPTSAIGYAGTLYSPVIIGSSSSNLNGYIKSLKYYPLRVSNTQLQLLTP